MTALSVIAAILALVLLIVIHEGGHYLCAIATGMKVDRFSVLGIGPVIWKLGTWRGTEFVISAIPFGAYVQIRGMEPTEEELEATGPVEKRVPNPDSGDFRDKPLWARSLALLGGPLANYLAAILLFFAVFAGFGLPEPQPGVDITDLNKDAPAMTAGIEVGDHVITFAGEPLTAENPVLQLVELSTTHLGKKVELEIERNGERKVIPVQLAEEAPALGASLEQPKVRKPVETSAAMGLALRRPFELTQRQLGGLWKLITGQVKAAVSGPVGIVQQMARQTRKGFVEWLGVAALISTLLGMFNLVPMPALDGGRLVFRLLEAVLPRPIRPRIEEAIHGYGMLGLLALIALVTVGDVRRLFS